MDKIFIEIFVILSISLIILFIFFTPVRMKSKLKEMTRTKSLRGEITFATILILLEIVAAEVFFYKFEAYARILLICFSIILLNSFKKLFSYHD